MVPAALDTLRIPKRFREAGFSEAQAETADVIREGVAGGDLVTKAGLSAAVTTLEAKIAEMKAELVKWMFGAMLAQGALVVTLIKLLPGK